MKDSEMENDFVKFLEKHMDDPVDLREIERWDTIKTGWRVISWRRESIPWWARAIIWFCEGERK